MKSLLEIFAGHDFIGKKQFVGGGQDHKRGSSVDYRLHVFHQIIENGDYWDSLSIFFCSDL